MIVPSQLNRKKGWVIAANALVLSGHESHMQCTTVLYCSILRCTIAPLYRECKFSNVQVR